MTALLLLALAAQAQDYSFPTSAEDYSNFYITAYYDHHGADWSCGAYQYSGHRGSDYGVGSWTGMDAGQDLVAAADGTVIYTNDGEYDRCSTGDCDGGGGYGNYVKLEHADGKFTYYAHMKQWSVAVGEGDWVPCGTKLGEVGSSGYSTGPHLHFEVREASGSQSDPFDGDCSFPPSYWVSQGSYMGVPALACEGGDPCEPSVQIGCGDRVEASNDGSGSTDAHAYYGCSEWTYTGPEQVFAFSTTLDESVSISLSGHSADLDLYVLSSTACDGSDCLAYSDNSETKAESVSFDATAGHSYVVVVDGYEDAVSSFVLELACDGAQPEDSDPPDPEDSEPPSDSDRGDSDPGDSEPEQDYPPGSRADGATEGCGCSSGTAPTASWLSLVGLLGLLGLRRQD